MTYTVTDRQPRKSAGDEIAVLADIDVTSYDDDSSGVEELTPSDFGLHRITWFEAQATENGYLIAFNGDTSNPAFNAFEASTDGTPLDEVVATTDIGTFTVKVYGKG